MLFRKRWMVGLGILFAGYCAAIPFQRQASDRHDRNQKLAVPNTDSQLQLLLLAAGSNPTNPPSLGIEDHHRIESLQLNVPPPQTAPGKPIQRVPSIEDRYPPGIRSLGQHEDKLSTGQSAAKGTARVHYHRIQDGDTLRTLAKHYLGDDDLAASIYDANRSILASPDLLPLGQQLRIPGPR